MVSNQVSVVSDPGNALSPNQFLTLGIGSISRTLPTAAGKSYREILGYRGPGISGWWRGEGNARDSVGNNNDGVPSASVVYVPGEVGLGFNMNGLDGSVRVPANASLDVGPGNGFTIEGWISPSLIGSEAPIAEWNDGKGDEGAHLWISVAPSLGSGPGCVYANLVDTSGNWHYFASAGGLVVANRFQHVGLTYDRRTGLARLYLNGTIVAQRNLGIFTPQTSFDFYLGHRPSGGAVSYWWRGVLDEISVYNRALSGSEIAGIYNKGTSGKFDPAALSPQNLAKANATIDSLNPTVLFGENTNWQTASLTFKAATNGTFAQIDGVEPGMLLDSSVLAQVFNYFPEEPFDPLIGDNAQGTWTLEIRDDRAGDPVGTLNFWSMQFILATNTPVAAGLTDGVTVTNTLGTCGFAYYAVDVPPEAEYATNVLVSASAPVNVWFNQTNPPTGTNAGDIELMTQVTGGSFTMFTNGVPPLVPGARYYLGVQNANCATNVTFVLRVDFGIDIIMLTNMVPYTNSNNGTNPVIDHYGFVVPPQAARAQFEIDNASQDMLLLAKKGLPLPDFSNFDYLSDNAGLVDELIVVLTNSSPVPLSAGNWYLSAINVSGLPVTYSALASWWATTGRPITITGGFVSSSNSFCITWSSLPGVHYYIQGTPSLGAGTQWTTIVPDIMGAADPATNTTWCVGLPSPYHYFRVVEGLFVGVPPPILSVSPLNGGYLLQWTGPVWAQYEVQWTGSLSSPWNTFPGIVTSTTGQFFYLDDGSQTGGLGPSRYYRVIVVAVMYHPRSCRFFAAQQFPACSRGIFFASFRKV